jgi:tetratricopeptide (TPR) repeat protein
MEERRKEYLRERKTVQRRRQFVWVVLLALPLACAVLYGIYRLPPVYSRLSWRLEELRTRVVYYFNPPDEAVFIPEEQQEIALIVQQTLAAHTLAAQAEPTATGTPTMITIQGGTVVPTFTPTITPTPLPERVELDGVVYVDQHNRWNYCGPANLTMALNFWGWRGNRDDVARVVKPGVNDPDLDFIQQGRPDKNVMPYELTDFVENETEFNAVLRIGGEIDLLQTLIANGFPVVIEKGYYEADYTGKIAWLGHYLFVTGYDDGVGAFIVQDAYLEPGQNLESPYDEFVEGWRSFNYTFFVVYPPEREAEVLALLGPWADVNWARQHALDLANEDIQTTEGIDEFFAWFNKGSSHVALGQYEDAAFSYDYAFLLYAQLDDDDNQRPYRIMWYQTGPYWAYYYTGRYNDVVSLANTTLNDTVSEPTLEESLYWRGLALWALGRTAEAEADFWEAVRLNPNFGPGWAILQQLGLSE